MKHLPRRKPSKLSAHRKAIKAELERILDQPFPLQLPWWIRAARERYGLPA